MGREEMWIFGDEKEKKGQNLPNEQGKGDYITQYGPPYYFSLNPP